MFIFKLLKWIFGLASGALSILMITYLSLKDENWIIADSDGQTVVDKTAGICLIVVWAVVGALFLLSEFLQKKSQKRRGNRNKRLNHVL